MTFTPGTPDARQYSATPSAHAMSLIVIMMVMIVMIVMMMATMVMMMVVMIVMRMVNMVPLLNRVQGESKNSLTSF